MRGHRPDRPQGSGQETPGIERIAGEERAGVQHGPFPGGVHRAAADDEIGMSRFAEDLAEGALPVGDVQRSSSAQNSQRAAGICRHRHQFLIVFRPRRLGGVEQVVIAVAGAAGGGIDRCLHAGPVVRRGRVSRAGDRRSFPTLLGAPRRNEGEPTSDFRSGLRISSRADRRGRVARSVRLAAAEPLRERRQRGAEGDEHAGDRKREARLRQPRRNQDQGREQRRAVG